MPACEKIMIAASLLACHSASALRVGSIGTRLAHVDPAVWTAAAGITATTAFVREEVATDKCFNITATAFERNRKALGKVLRSMQEDYSEFFGLGLCVRLLLEMNHLLVSSRCSSDCAASFSGDNPVWPKVTRLLAGGAASCSVMGLHIGMAAGACVIGLLGPVRLLTRLV